MQNEAEKFFIFKKNPLEHFVKKFKHETHLFLFFEKLFDIKAPNYAKDSK